MEIKILLKVIVLAGLTVFSLHAGNSYNKSMAKNRASSNIGNSNYKVINNNRQYREATKDGKEIGTNIKGKGIKYGNVINYVEIKNVKMRKGYVKKHKYGLAKIKKDKAKKKLYGVKVDKKFKGNIQNTVIIKNSNLH